jgi:Zn-dependent protease
MDRRLLRALERLDSAALDDDWAACAADELYAEEGGRARYEAEARRLVRKRATEHAWNEPRQLSELAVSIALFVVSLQLAFSMSLAHALAITAMVAAHEAGHFYAFRRYALPVRRVLFVPLLGAFVAARAPATARQALWTMIAGPLVGGLFAGAALGIGLALDVHLLVFAGWIGLVFNVFNLLPVGGLDGGQIARELFDLWRLPLSVFSIAIVAAIGLYFAAALLTLIAFPSFWSAAKGLWRRRGTGAVADKARTDRDNAERLTRGQRLRWTAGWLALSILLATPVTVKAQHRHWLHTHVQRCVLVKGARGEAEFRPCQLTKVDRLTPQQRAKYDARFNRSSSELRALLVLNRIDGEAIYVGYAPEDKR